VDGTLDPIDCAVLVLRRCRAVVWARAMNEHGLSARIRGRLDALGISQSELRKALSRHGVEVSKQTVSGWSTGVQRPSPRHLRALLDALVVPTDERVSWLDCWVAGSSK
jgi:transcriptional regulator with XRE-family HTH domain